MLKIYKQLVWQSIMFKISTLVCTCVMLLQRGRILRVNISSVSVHTVAVLTQISTVADSTLMRKQYNLAIVGLMASLRSAVP